MINGKLPLSHLYWLSTLEMVTPCMCRLDNNQCTFENSASHPLQGQLIICGTPFKMQMQSLKFKKQEKNPNILLSSVVTLNVIVFFICYLLPHFLRHEDSHRVHANLHRLLRPCPVFSTGVCCVPNPDLPCAHT